MRFEKPIKRIICKAYGHDWKTYHRWFRDPQWEEGSADVVGQLLPKLILRAVRKCKRCGKKIYEH